MREPVHFYGPWPPEGEFVAGDRWTFSPLVYAIPVRVEETPGRTSRLPVRHRGGKRIYRVVRRHA